MNELLYKTERKTKTSWTKRYYWLSRRFQRCF